MNKKEAFIILEDCSIPRKDFLVELQNSCGSFPYTDNDYEKAIKRFGIVKVNQHD